MTVTVTVTLSVISNGAVVLAVKMTLNDGDTTYILLESIDNSAPAHVHTIHTMQYIHAMAATQTKTRKRSPRRPKINPPRIERIERLEITTISALHK
jgi:hypothetical protein